MTDQGNRGKKADTAGQPTPLHRKPFTHTMTFDAVQKDASSAALENNVGVAAASQNKTDSAAAASSLPQGKAQEADGTGKATASPKAPQKTLINTMDLTPPISGVLVSETPVIRNKAPQRTLINTMDLTPPISGVLVSDTPAVLGRRIAQEDFPDASPEKYYTPEALNQTGALNIADGHPTDAMLFGGDAVMPPSGEFVEWTASKASLIAAGTMEAPSGASLPAVMPPSSTPSASATGAKPSNQSKPPAGQALSHPVNADLELFLATKPIVPKDPLAGQIVNGRFVLRSLLGRGGMGKVYLAEQLGLGRSVAIKLLHDELMRQADRKQRFEREARSMTRFVHPNAVMVYDYGEWEGRSYIAMEYLQGRSLEDLIKHEFPLSEERIVGILGQVCDVLISAHGAGLIHRDLKPENVMILKDRDGKEIVKVVDFGLAVLVGTSVEERLTVEGVTMGTPYYMSPEQCRGQMDIDARSDIYALGVLLYELLCGELPFSGDNIMAVLMQQMFVEPTPPSVRYKEKPINAALEKLALQSMSKDPNQRPKDTQQFLTALRSAKQAQSNDEVKRFLEQADRASRAAAVGIPALPARSEVAEDPLRDEMIWVVESGTQTDPSHSILASLSANGYRTTRFSKWSDLAAALQEGRSCPLVVDLRPPFGARWEDVMGLFQQQGHSSPIFLVGEDGDFMLMNKALEVGAAGYVASSDVMSKMPRLLRKAMRRSERQKKP
ncbi:serine/threonine protein kinase [Myxococcota bacterium]|nr:serine/threonine protein kinase [Myxococcota bacterium]